MEAISFEIEYNRNIVRSCIYDIEGWVADEYVEKNFFTLLDTTYIHREPFGVCLIMGAWNYPVVRVLFYFFKFVWCRPFIFSDKCVYSDL